MPRYEVEGVQKAISLLRALARADRPLGASDLGRELGLGRSTVFRLLYTLQLDGMVRQDEETKKYRLGPDLAALGRAASDDFDLRREARPAMEKLAAAVNLPVFLNVPGAADVICLEHVASLNVVELYGRAGSTLPYHACPSGYVLLAFGPAERLEQVLAGPLPRHASATPDADALRTVVEEVRRTGVAYGRDDLDEGVSSLAVPLLDSHGHPLASLGLAGFSVAFDDRLDDLTASLRAAAAQISEHPSPAVGHGRPTPPGDPQ
ncbi:IclR family transcriptional regulator [Nocardioides sp. LHD-245]|uniref:IclR family transcriptional regulator n=1 Tax=Nocardioides sp. LHD-245 TaxID=3051387 RepID=UPI0027E02B75|nr:IclR family transcriptional regulator [Nocardioides sp. LHD-245]